MCCSVLQCVGVLQCVAVRVLPVSRGLQKPALQHTATHCNTLQHICHTVTHCKTLQQTATHCNTLQHTTVTSLVGGHGSVGAPLPHSYIYTYVYMYTCPPDPVNNVLQCVAMCCSVLQCSLPGKCISEKCFTCRSVQYLKSCSYVFILKNLIHRTRSYDTAFITQLSWLLHFYPTKLCRVEIICTSGVPVPKRHLGGANP